MKKFVLVALLITGTAHASNIKEIRDIIKYVESSGNPFAVGDGGASLGLLQIQQAVIADINRKYGTDYIHADAFDENCANEIFELYTNMWTENLEKKLGREATEEDIVKIWNGGPNGYKLELRDYLNKYVEKNNDYYQENNTR